MLRDRRTTAELVAAALAEADRLDEPRNDYSAVAILQARGSQEVLKAALTLCASLDPKARRVGAS